MAILTLRRLRCACLVVLLAIAAVSVHGEDEDTIENDVKAAFLYNFAKYVEWPPASFAASDRFRICAIADPNFLRALDLIIAGESIGGRQVTRVQPPDADSARTCHILFVGRDQMVRAARVLAAVRGEPVLTVGDTADFLSRGGVIAFVREGNRVRFDINVIEAEHSGLTISSRLLRVARHVAEPIFDGR